MMGYIHGYLCDRCGNTYYDFDEPKLFLLDFDGKKSGDLKYLCPKCNKELSSWYYEKSILLKIPTIKKPTIKNAEDVKKYPIPDKNSIDLSSIQFKEVDV